MDFYKSDFIPSSVIDCLDDDGNLQDYKYIEYLRLLLLDSGSSSDSLEVANTTTTWPQRRPFKCRKNTTIGEYLAEDGTYYNLSPDQSNWYFFYIKAMCFKDSFLL